MPRNVVVPSDVGVESFGIFLGTRTLIMFLGTM